MPIPRTRYASDEPGFYGSARLGSTQSGGSQKLNPTAHTRTRRSECISIMPDGTRTVFRAAAGTTTPRSTTRHSTPRITKSEQIRNLIMSLPATNGGNPDA